MKIEAIPDKEFFPYCPIRGKICPSRPITTFLSTKP